MFACTRVGETQSESASLVGKRPAGRYYGWILRHELSPSFVRAGQQLLACQKDAKPEIRIAIRFVREAVGNDTDGDDWS